MPISDAEREALIKERVAYHNYNFANDLTFAVHRLGEVELELAEARAEIALLTEQRDDAQAAYLRVHKDKCDALGEIARLRAPPGESAMERGARAVGWGTMPPIVTLFPRQLEIIEGAARAIEQAEQNARRAAYEACAQHMTHRYGRTPLGLTLAEACRALAEAPTPTEGE